VAFLEDNNSTHSSVQDTGNVPVVVQAWMVEEEYKQGRETDVQKRLL